MSPLRCAKARGSRRPAICARASPSIGTALRNNGSHAPGLDGVHSDLPARREPAVGTALPLLSKLLLLRAHGDRTPWSAARQLARRQTPSSLPAVFVGRLRPRARLGAYPE